MPDDLLSYATPARKPLCRFAVWSLVLALCSPLSIVAAGTYYMLVVGYDRGPNFWQGVVMSLLLLLIPTCGILAGIAAAVRLHRAAGDMRGTGLAISGMIIAGIFETYYLYLSTGGFP